MEAKFYLNSSARIFLESIDDLRTAPHPGWTISKLLGKLDDFVSPKFAKKTAKQYYLNVIRIIDIFEEMDPEARAAGGLCSMFSKGAEKSRGLILLRMLVPHIETLRVSNPDRPASNSLKRNYIDACFFLLDMIVHRASIPGVYRTTEIDALRDYRALLETRITLESASREPEFPSKRELVNLIRKTYPVKSEPFCVLMIYAHVPIRDDIGEVRIICKPGAIDLWKSQPCTMYGNIILTEEAFDMEIPPKTPFTLYICNSKTIGTDPGATYRPFFAELTMEITNALWEWCVYKGNGWTTERSLPLDDFKDNTYHCECSMPLFFTPEQEALRASKGYTAETRPYKISQNIIGWMKHMGIKGGCNYFRKAHNCWIRELKDPQLIAIVNQQSGHTESTASISYKGKRKIDEI